MPHPHKIILVLACCFLTWLPVKAQKVAVVLSGGGAKGSAHVGMLRALEENCIPIDYIAGTSMGAIVGSMYAAGYTPNEIEKIISSDEFLSWANGKIENKYVYYFKKDNPDASWITIKINYDSILSYKLPTNIISPFQIDFGFMYFLAAAGVAANNNFDSLYIPFRCVASDIAEKKAISFSHGYLPEAVRASMTYPFYFRPIKIDNHLLFDGGMYNNFPSDIALNDFNPDIIIGCNVAANSGTPDENDIISQIENMLTTNTNYSVICDNSVMITPQLPKVKEFGFDKASELIDSGYAATIRKIPEIRLFVHDSVCAEKRNAMRNKFLASKPPLLFDSITITGVNQYQAVYIRKSIMHRDSTFDIEQLKQEYFKLLADDKIESIYPKAVYNKKTGLFTLNLDVKRDKNFAAQFGGIISSSNINGAFVGLQYKYLGLMAAKISVNFSIGRFYSAAQAKSRFDFPSVVPFYLETAVGFNQWDYFKTTIRFFEDKLPSYLLENEINFIADFGFPAYNNGKLLIGPSIARTREQYYQTNQFSKTDTADQTTFNFFTIHTQFNRFSLNAKKYPTAGTSLIFDVRYVVGSEENIPGSTSINKKIYKKTHDWVQIKIQYDRYFKLKKIYSLGIYAETIITNKPLFNNYTSSLLSAPTFHPTTESEAFFLPDYRANTYAVFGIKNIINIYKKIHFRLEGYLFQPYQAIKPTEDYKASYGKPFETRFILGYAALVYNSPICPISISLSYYSHKEDPFSVMFNIGYLIFNKRAMD
ncbi:MAG: patatin-like phospholipase family protein [Bacteroidota bacterium]